MDERKSKSGALIRGVMVFAALGVLTAVEYLIGILELQVIGTILLIAIAVVKAALVIWYFMHIGRIFSEEEGHE